MKLKQLTQAMILAAGRGERLRPLTDKVPKTLLPIAGIPIIERNIIELKLLGIKHFVINLHHLGKQIETQLKNGEHFGVKISYSWEKNLLGTGGGIAKMLTQINSDDFICVNGDSLWTIDLKPLWDMHQRSKSMATMLLCKAGDSDESIVTLTANNQVVRISKEHPTFNPSHTPCHFVGVHIFSTEFLKKQLPNKERAFSIIDEGYHKWLRDGSKISGWLCDAPLLDIGTPERYSQVQDYFLKQGLS